MRYLVILCILLATNAQAIELGLPLNCQFGKDCFIEQYVDHAQGEAWQDYRCRHLASQEHQGTDFAVPTALYGKPVQVLAVADGVVTAIRDGEADIFRRHNKQYNDSRGCGNSVYISHQDGYRTLTCHMQKGSIRVQKGQQVNAGDVLGTVGISGNTDFPHAHVELTQNGKVIDPFTGHAQFTSCQTKSKPLWSKAALKQLTYQRSAIMSMGLTDSIPNKDTVMQGKHQHIQLSPDSKQLLVWSEIIGYEAGDILHTTLRLPNNTEEKFEHVLPKSQVYGMFYSGIKAPKEGFSRGIYVATIELKGKNGYSRRRLKSFTVF
jgi:hypothetical protein